MMKHLSLIAAVLLIPAAAAASEPETVSFEHQGNRYTYTVTEAANGMKTLKGREERSRTPFFLRVGKSRVTGTYGNTFVTFLKKETETVQGSVTVASK